MNINKIDPRGRTLYADSVLNRIVTAYPCATDSTPYRYKDGAVAGFNMGKMLLSPPPPELAALQADIRTEADPDRRADLKRAMLAFTPAAFVAPTRKAANVQHFTGLLPFDIDAKDNADRLEDYDNLKDEISKIPYVAYCGRSLSGTGFWGMMFAGYHINGHDDYKAAFAAMERDFVPMGIIIDPAPSNPASLRFYAYDPAGYFNHYPQPYERRYIAPPAPKPAANSYTLPTSQIGETSPRPGDVFNSTYSPIDILTAHGWKLVRQTPTESHLRRPGARTNGHDATYYADNGKVKVWSPSAGLPTHREYSAFALFAYLEHGGDFTNAANALRAAGVQ